jgi:AcrR family transcriptional regulator
LLEIEWRLHMIPEVTVPTKSSRPRGRPRSFDPIITLGIIRACFAKGGFAGTSIEHLSEATGLSTPSLYNAFGDKKSMYLHALDLEYEEVLARLHGLKERPTRDDLIVAYVEAATAGYGSSAEPPGIAFRAALTDANEDPEIDSRLRHFLATLDEVAAEVLGPGAPPSAAKLLSTLAMGLCMRSRPDATSIVTAELAALAHLL